jgi:hypothetical protein
MVLGTLFGQIIPLVLDARMVLVAASSTNLTNYDSYALYLFSPRHFTNISRRIIPVLIAIASMTFAPFKRQ